MAKNCRWRRIVKKWIFRTKTVDNNTVYRARLVAQRFEQNNIDYSELYASVASLATVKVFFPIANHLETYVRQIGVECTFFNETFSNKVFVEVPGSLSISNNVVCELEKLLYGLKETRCCRNE